MDTGMLEGGCRCGAVRYRISARPVMSGMCHCESCRRSSGAPVVGWVTVREPAFRFTVGAPAVHESSPGVRRAFCARCGTPLTFTADDMRGLVDVTTGSLDRPDRVPPTLHYWVSQRLPWLRLDDGLPQHEGPPPTGADPA